MSAIIAIVTQINHFNAPAGTYRIQGSAEVDGGLVSVDWEVFANFSDPVINVNKACMDNAVAAVQAAGFTVLPSDTKTLFGAAVIG